MSVRYLGERFDIHTGGIDLATVHHTNEVAQSECGFGVHPWVGYLDAQRVSQHGQREDVQIEGQT